MEKIEFEYQRWYLRIFCALCLLPVLLLLQFGIEKMIPMKDSLYLMMCATTAIFASMLYYKYTENAKMFFEKGYYWIDNGVVFIEKKNKVYEIKNVEWLRGDMLSIYGTKASMLVVEYQKKKFMLCSKPLKEKVDFSKTDFYEIFELILLHNPQLEKDKSLDYWYEVPKVKKNRIF